MTLKTNTEQAMNVESLIGKLFDEYDFGDKIRNTISQLAGTFIDKNEITSSSNFKVSPSTNIYTFDIMFSNKLVLTRFRFKLNVDKPEEHTVSILSVIKFDYLYDHSVYDKRVSLFPELVVKLKNVKQEMEKIKKMSECVTEFRDWYFDLSLNVGQSQQVRLLCHQSDSYFVKIYPILAPTEIETKGGLPSITFFK
jgi:hypothetical protein